jgi:hypothetical protein
MAYGFGFLPLMSRRDISWVSVSGHPFKPCMASPSRTRCSVFDRSAKCGARA